MSNDLIRVVAVLIIAAVLITALRSRLAEYSFVLAIAVAVIALGYVCGNVFSSVVKLRQIFNQGIGEEIYFSTALKSLGVSYITTFAADLCRDYGMSSLAQTAELSGKVAIFLLCMPLVSSLLDMVLSFTKI